MKILLALIKKEFLQIIRDPSAILIAFVLPLVLLFIFGYGVNLDSGRTRVGVIMESSDPDSVSLLTAYTNSRYFEVRVGRDRREFADEITAGRLRGMVVIPEELQKELAGAGPVVVQVITDGSETNSASFVKNYAEGALNTWLTHTGDEQGGLNRPPFINLEPRFWYNQELASRNFLIPGSLSIVMTLVGVILTALVIAREWERGTMEALMATPVSIFQIIFAKLVTYYGLALMSMSLSWAVAVFWYGVPFRGSLPALLAVSSVFLMGALGQGLLISTVTKDQYLAAQLALVTGFLPGFILSGFIFEIGSMPGPIQAFTHILPAKYFVSCLQTIFLAGDIWPLFLRSMAAMAVIGLLLFIITAKKTVKKVA
jgi:ABC-type multidrug transport system, permease component